MAKKMAKKTDWKILTASGVSLALAVALTIFGVKQCNRANDAEAANQEMANHSNQEMDSVLRANKYLADYNDALKKTIIDNNKNCDEANQVWSDSVDALNESLNSARERIKFCEDNHMKKRVAKKPARRVVKKKPVCKPVCKPAPKPCVTAEPIQVNNGSNGSANVNGCNNVVKINNGIINHYDAQPVVVEAAATSQTTVVVEELYYRHR